MFSVLLSLIILCSFLLLYKILNKDLWRQSAGSTGILRTLNALQAAFVQCIILHCSKQILAEIPHVP